MQFNVKTGKPEKQRTACLIAGVYENGRLSPTAAALDAAGEGSVTRLLKGGDLKGKPGQTLLAHQVGGLSCDRLLLVGCGKNGELAETDYRKAVNAAMAALKATAAKEALCCLAEIPVKGRDVLWKVRRAMEAAGNALYRFDQMKSDKKAEGAPVLKKLAFIAAAGAEAEQAKRAVREGKAVNAGLNLAKTLADLPGNVCTPTYLAEQAQALGRRHKGVKVRVLEEKDMEKLGMGALLSVARGSRQPAKLITLEYKGAGAKKQPVALVGKGLTFDAGGISLKPASNMDEMKYDMCGAAAVLGILEAAAELELPLNLVGVIPSSENLPDGDANKPGDIVTSLSGQTIEVLNTDAEGRLILCDALTYTRKFAPEVVIDIATLTGACVIALGGQASGLLGNNQELADALLAAGQTTGDRAWQLPLWDEYQEQLKSNFADMANIGGREAGTITAACFLSRYTKDYRWAHLDIAGTAWRGGKEKGATGRPVPLLMQYLIDRAQEKGRAK